MAARTGSFDTEARRLERRLPDFAGRWFHRARHSSIWLRWTIGILFMLGGLLEPLFAFWMFPLGLILIAQDVPSLRPRFARFFAYIRRKTS